MVRRYTVTKTCARNAGSLLIASHWRKEKGPGRDGLDPSCANAVSESWDSFSALRATGCGTNEKAPAAIFESPRGVQISRKSFARLR
jgi:hypothetical protein